MKKHVATLAVLVLTGILFSCHPDQLEGNPLLKNDGEPISGGEYSSSSSSMSSSSSLESSSSIVTPSSSSNSSSSIAETCTAANNTATQYCSNGEMKPYGSFEDSDDGNIYKTVVIGDQTWMAENLKYNANSSVCYYEDQDFCSKHGRLYNWKTARTACPDGWRLPSTEDWDALLDYAGGSSTAGEHLKAMNGWDWDNGLDTYGFAALPGGYGEPDGNFVNRGVVTYWWSSTEYNNNYAYIVYLYESEEAGWDEEPRSHLLSVRCIQD